MTPANSQQHAAVFPDAAAPSSAQVVNLPKGAPSPTASVAAEGIAARLRNLAERPTSVLVRDLIDRYMAVYAGRDVALVQRLTTWQAILGDVGRLHLGGGAAHRPSGLGESLPRH